MIVKILKSCASFKAVRYNTDKVENEKGELMKVSGFGALLALDNLRPADYVNYLTAQSSLSKRTKNPQFHAVLSAKGRSHSKHELVSLAEQWLKGMGYGDQPYLLVFHKDTANNHIHMVSTRVDRNGKKINDNYEKLKAYQVLEKVMGQDQERLVAVDIQNAMAYSFSSHAQFKLLLEASGYKVRLEGNSYQLYKFGSKAAEVKFQSVAERIANYTKDQARTGQLRAIIDKYKRSCNPALMLADLPKRSGDRLKPAYASELTMMLKEKFGIDFIFHFKDGKAPYGYTVIDHATKRVYKGAELLALSELLQQVEGSSLDMARGNLAEESEAVSPTEEIPLSSKPEVGNSGTPEKRQMADGWTPESESNQTPSFADFQLDISDDIDDEAILGRNRKRKRKARTNTR